MKTVVKWWQPKDEKRLIEFAWLWWDVPGLMIPNYWSYKALASFYRSYGVIDLAKITS